MNESKQFQADGVVVVRDVLDRNWLRRLAEAVEENMAHPGPYGKKPCGSRWCLFW